MNFSKFIICILLAKINQAYDPGCSPEYPRRCPNSHVSDTPICEDNYLKCEAFQGCSSSEAPYLCPNGECALNFKYCRVKTLDCESAHFSKCTDGLCREDCSFIKHSSCDFSKPIRCPDGRCVTTEVMCASNKCPIHQPFLSADG